MALSNKTELNGRGTAIQPDRKGFLGLNQRGFSLFGKGNADEASINAALAELGKIAKSPADGKTYAITHEEKKKVEEVLTVLLDDRKKTISLLTQRLFQKDTSAGTSDTLSFLAYYGKLMGKEEKARSELMRSVNDEIAKAVNGKDRRRAMLVLKNIFRTNARFLKSSQEVFDALQKIGLSKDEDDSIAAVAALSASKHVKGLFALVTIMNEQRSEEMKLSAANGIKELGLAYGEAALTSGVQDIEAAAGKIKNSTIQSEMLRIAAELKKPPKPKEYNEDPGGVIAIKALLAETIRPGEDSEMKRGRYLDWLLHNSSQQCVDDYLRYLDALPENDSMKAPSVGTVALAIYRNTKDEKIIGAIANHFTSVVSDEKQKEIAQIFCEAGKHWLLTARKEEGKCAFSSMVPEAKEIILTKYAEEKSPANFDELRSLLPDNQGVRLEIYNAMAVSDLKAHANFVYTKLDEPMDDAHSIALLASLSHALKDQPDMDEKTVLLVRDASGKRRTKYPPDVMIAAATVQKALQDRSDLKRWLQDDAARKEAAEAQQRAHEAAAPKHPGGGPTLFDRDGKLILPGAPKTATPKIDISIPQPPSAETSGDLLTELDAIGALLGTPVPVPAPAPEPAAAPAISELVPGAAAPGVPVAPAPVGPAPATPAAKPAIQVSAPVVPAAAPVPLTPEQAAQKVSEALDGLVDARVNNRKDDSAARSLATLQMNRTLAVAEIGNRLSLTPQEVPKVTALIKIGIALQATELRANLAGFASSPVPELVVEAAHAARNLGSEKDFAAACGPQAAQVLSMFLFSQADAAKNEVIPEAPVFHTIEAMEISKRPECCDTLRFLFDAESTIGDAAANAVGTLGGDKTHGELEDQWKRSGNELEKARCEIAIKAIGKRMHEKPMNITDAKAVEMEGIGAEAEKEKAEQLAEIAKKLAASNDVAELANAISQHPEICVKRLNELEMNTDGIREISGIAMAKKKAGDAAAAENLIRIVNAKIDVIRERGLAQQRDAIATASDEHKVIIFLATENVALRADAANRLAEIGKLAAYEKLNELMPYERELANEGKPNALAEFEAAISKLSDYYAEPDTEIYGIVKDTDPKTAVGVEIILSTLPEATSARVADECCRKLGEAEPKADVIAGLEAVLGREDGFGKAEAEAALAKLRGAEPEAPAQAPVVPEAGAPLLAQKVEFTLASLRSDANKIIGMTFETAEESARIDRILKEICALPPEEHVNILTDFMAITPEYSAANAKDPVFLKFIELLKENSIITEAMLAPVPARKEEPLIPPELLAAASRIDNALLAGNEQEVIAAAKELAENVAEGMKHIGALQLAAERADLSADTLGALQVAIMAISAAPAEPAPVPAPGPAPAAPMISDTEQKRALDANAARIFAMVSDVQQKRALGANIAGMLDYYAHLLHKDGDALILNDWVKEGRDSAVAAATLCSEMVSKGDRRGELRLVLLNASRSSEPDVRKASVSALVDFGDSKTLRAACAIALDPDASVRAVAYNALKRAAFENKRWEVADGISSAAAVGGSVLDSRTMRLVPKIRVHALLDQAAAEGSKRDALYAQLDALPRADGIARAIARRGRDAAIKAEAVKYLEWRKGAAARKEKEGFDRAMTDFDAQQKMAFSLLEEISSMPAAAQKLGEIEAKLLPEIRAFVQLAEELKANHHRESAEDLAADMRKAVLVLESAKYEFAPKEPAVVKKARRTVPMKWKVAAGVALTLGGLLAYNALKPSKPATLPDDYTVGAPSGPASGPATGTRPGTEAPAGEAMAGNEVTADIIVENINWLANNGKLDRKKLRALGYSPSFVSGLNNEKQQALLQAVTTTADSIELYVFFETYGSNSR